MEDRTLKQLLMSSSYFVLNKQIVKSLGIESAFLLTILIEASDGLSDDEGWFYQTIEKIGELTGIGRHKQDKIIKDLIELKILEQKNKGVPCKRYFKINYSMIEDLVFFNPQTRLSEIDNNKEYIINNLNKELNHKEHKSYEHEFADDDLKKIKQWFVDNGVDFSKKHEAKVLELLKNNSLGFILKTFQEQLNILKNKSDVKNVAAVFSTHLFKGTTEVNTKEIEKREAEKEKIKNEERKEYTDNDKVIEVFKNLPAEQQLEIENEVIEKMNNPMLKEIKRNAENVFYLMISKELKEKMFKLGIKF